MKATLHRVLDIGIERFSSPFFLRPKYSAMIPSDILTKDTKNVAPPSMFGDHYYHENIKTAGWEGFQLPDFSGRHRDKSGKIVMNKAKSGRASARGVVKK